jgi:hypothetical protein
MIKREEKQSLLKRKENLFCLFFSLFFFLISSCGDPQATYNIGKSLTNNENNILLIETKTRNKFQFKLVQTSGPKGLKANVSFDTFVDIPEKITFSYKEEGVYTVSITTQTKSDKLIVSEEKIEWEYSEKKPPAPLFSISEGEYTRKDVVTLQFSKENLEEDHDITEVWLAGDLDSGNNGAWYPLSSDFEIKQTLSFSPINGKKIIQAKYRNAFGTEGELFSVTIIKKNNKPTDCVALFSDIGSGGIIHKDTVSFTLKVKDYIEGFEGIPENYFRIRGTDGTETEWTAFKEKVETSFTLKDPAKETKYTIAIEVKDIVGNKCDLDDLAITYDPDERLTPNLDFIGTDHPLWTNSQDLTLKIYHPKAKEKNLEIYIYGDISGDNTYTWLPYSQEGDETFWNVKISNSPFHKWIRVNFRESGKTESIGIQEKPIFLQPYFNIEEKDSFLYVHAARFTTEHVESITITGCEEIYENIPYDEYNKDYLCTPKEGVTKIIVNHFFNKNLELDEEYRVLTLEKDLP